MSSIKVFTHLKKDQSIITVTKLLNYHACVFLLLLFCTFKFLQKRVKRQMISKEINKIMLFLWIMYVEHWKIVNIDLFRRRYGLQLGLHDILHAIVMRISSVKAVLWLAVNLLQLFSNGAAFNTQSRSSLTSYAISRSLSHAMHLWFWAWIASLVRELRLCVLNAAPFENSWSKFTANHRTVFTEEIRMTIACNISCSPKYIVLFELTNESFSWFINRKIWFFGKAWIQ